jgi:hypothetical protein
MRPAPALDVSPQAIVGVPLPVPQLFCRHYTRNYLDLFQEILRRLYHGRATWTHRSAFDPG